MGKQGFYRNRQLAYDWLKSTFPLVFGRDTPLKAGIHRDILSLDVPDKPAKVNLRHAIALHVSRVAYLNRLKQGVGRIDLLGSECGQVVSEEEALKAKEKIQSRQKYYQNKKGSQRSPSSVEQNERAGRTDTLGRPILSLKKKKKVEEQV